MTDIHCHILPNLDDGAQSVEEALQMAQLAVVSGVTDIITTPHFPADSGGMNLAAKMLEQYNLLQQALQEADIPVTLHPGAEILCLPATTRLGRQGMLPTLGTGKYLLTEFYFDESSRYIEDTLTELQSQGYMPIIAHPERYIAVQQNLHLAERWFSQGVLLQVNKGSALGAFGKTAQATAEHILFHGLAHVLASDAHHADYRTPHMGALQRWALENLGWSYTQLLLEKNPRRILMGEPPIPAD